MKKKILMLTITLLAVTMLATPIIGTVTARGPLKALEVGKNPKVDGFLPMDFVMLDDAGPNNIFWMNPQDIIRNMPDARKGEGRMNNAIIADHDMILAMQADKTLYENKWLYLSGTGGEQWNGHGMVYWIFFPMFGDFISGLIEQEYSDGCFLIRRVVGK